MNDAQSVARQSLVLRVLWMLVFALGWLVAEALLLVVVLFQLGYRLIYGAPHSALLAFGDSLSQFFTQMGRFQTFNTDEKPWPCSPWPVARAAEVEAVHPEPSPGRDTEPKQ